MSLVHALEPRNRNRRDNRLGEIDKAVLEYKTPEGKSVKIRIGAAGKGAQSIIPPSPDREWLTGQSLDECELAPLPELVIERLLASARAKRSAVKTAVPGESIKNDAADKALKAMLKGKAASDKNDGSKRLFRVCCRAVEHDLDVVTALRVIRQYEELRPFPCEWSDEGILTRLRDAELKATRGRALSSRKHAERICLADVEPQSLEWLWPDRIPLGKMTLLVGDPDVGKSLCSLDIAARVTRGEPWPDNPGEKQPTGSVVLLSAEDDLADTIRPRLDALGADVSRIMLISAICDTTCGDQRRGVDLGRDVEALAEVLHDNEECRLVIVDPISAYLGKSDTHNNSEVRAVLAPLSELAARMRVAVLAITHLRKGEGSAMVRAMGSMAFIAAARAGWLVCRDGNRRLFLPIKNNLASDDVYGLAYQIESHGKSHQPVVNWLPDRITITADEALQKPPAKRGPKPDAFTDALQFLEGKITDRPQLIEAIVKEALECGISDRTLSRAAEAMGVVTSKNGFGGACSWVLPA